MIPLLITILLATVLAAIAGRLFYEVLCQNGRILARLEALEREVGRRHVESRPDPARPSGLPVGSPAPDFELAAVTGGRKRLSGWRGRPVLLIFFNPGCGFCAQMVPDLAALPTEPSGGAPLPVVVTTGSADEIRKLAKEHGLCCPVLLQGGSELAVAYGATGTPMGYLLDAEGRIASDLAAGAGALLALAEKHPDQGPSGAANADAGSNGHARQRGNRSLSESRLNRSGLAAGTSVPSFRVPRLDGGELSIQEYRGRRVLLVFSDPHCGPCDALAPRLERAARGRADVHIVVVSRGDIEANRRKVTELGLTFPIGLQRQWEISKLYAMFATPIAYLIDEEGRTAADVAVGVEPILALLTGSESSGDAAGRAATRREPAPSTR